MAMIEVCARLTDLGLSANSGPKWRDWTNIEAVRLAASWWNGALCKTHGTIHRSGSLLIETMPVESSALVAKLILNIHDYIVPYRSPERWTRPLSINANNWSD
jgi:hypothetical protein